MNATEMTNEQQAKAKAEAYLKQKSRLTYYIFSGYTAEDDDFEHGFYIASTPEEMQQLVQEIIETYNQYYSDSKPVTTLEQVKKEVNLWEFEDILSEHKELKQCLDERNLTLTDIDLQPRHLYTMSLICWDPSDQKTSPRLKFSVELTDDEYVCLLTEQLLYPENYTFNRLAFDHPEVAKKISLEADSLLGYGVVLNGLPFLVIMDEVDSDVETINKQD